MKTLFLLLLFSLRAIAGDKGGNGGVSMVCRTGDELITYAELLDIYEGRVIFGLDYADKKKEDYINLALSRLAAKPNFQKMVANLLESHQRKIRFIPTGNILELTDDALPTIKRKDCGYEQLANFTNDGFLLISTDIHEAMTELNRAALLLHEAVYASLRKLGDKESTRARRIVAQLLAEEPDQEYLETLLHEVHFVINGTFADLGNGCALIIEKNGDLTIQNTHKCVGLPMSDEVNFSKPLYPMLSGRARSDQIYFKHDPQRAFYLYIYFEDEHTVRISTQFDELFTERARVLYFDNAVGVGRH